MRVNGGLKMEIKNVPIGKIVPYENNPRRNEEAVEYVRRSIEEFGFKNPILLDKNNVIVAGHTRLEAAKKLGYTECPCIYVDDLTPEQVNAFRLADNKTAEIAEWDGDLLKLELGKIVDIDMTEFGFDLGEEIEKELKKQKSKAEVEFTEVLGEEHNYIVLYFDNEVDWLQVESLLDIGEKKNLSTRKDGKINKGFERCSVGRVLKGTEVLERLRQHYENIG